MAQHFLRQPNANRRRAIVAITDDKGAPTRPDAVRDTVHDLWEADAVVPRVALISHALWKSRFGGDGLAVGKRIEIDGQPTLVVGVLPADFELPTLDRAALLLPQALPPNPPPGTRPLRIYGQLREGVSARQARDAKLELYEKLVATNPSVERKGVASRAGGVS